jgi:hypothetical protein
VLRHLNKTAGGPAIYRGGGSIGIVGAVRSALIVGLDPGNAHRRVLAVLKCNLAARATSLAYTLESVGQDVARVAWVGETDLSPEDILAHPGGPRKQAVGEQCAAAISQILAGRVMDSGELESQLREMGYSERAILRGRQLAGVQARRVGFGPGASYQVTLAEDHHVPP